MATISSPTLTDSDGQSLSFAYNALGLISQLTDEAGLITIYTYDPSSEELLSVTGPGGTTSYTYDNGSNIETLHALLSITNPDGTHEYFQYDSQGRLIGQSQDGGANAITYAYDVGPGGYRVIDALGNSTTMLLNDAGETAQVIDALGGVTNFSYDASFQPCPGRCADRNHDELQIRLAGQRYPGMSIRWATP